MINIENSCDGTSMLKGWQTKVTDEDGKPITGIKEIDIHINVDGVVTSNIKMYCSHLKVCADHTNQEEMCPILGISMLNRHKKKATIVPYKEKR